MSSDSDEYDWHIDYAELWLGDYELMRPRSVSTRRNQLRKFDSWAEENGVDSIQDVDYRAIKRFTLTQNNEYATKTAEGRYQAVISMVDEAVNEHILDEHPLPREFQLSDWGISRNKTQREKFLKDNDLEEGIDEDEFEKLRANVPAPKSRNQLLVDLLYYTGARASEITPVTLSDVDLDKRIIKVPDRKKDDPDETRKVRYSSRCDQAMDAWMTDRRAFSCIQDASEEWLFCSRKKAPLHPDNLPKIINKAATDAGIQQVIGHDANGDPRYYVNTHSLRHAHGTKMVDEVGVHRVQEQMGHSSVEVTESTYIHTDSEDESNPYHDAYEG